MCMVGLLVGCEGNEDTVDDGNSLNWSLFRGDASLSGYTCLLYTSVAGGMARRVEGTEASLFWQIDPNVCTQCGRCETHCVLPVSAVKCIHANKVCGYCDLCGGYYRTNVKELNTAAENMMCPTGAILRLSLIHI